MSGEALRRASRRKRVRGRTPRLRARDIEIFECILRMRAVRTSDIARLFFKGKGTAQKRLRRLLDGAFIRPIVADLATESRWTLTRTGYEILQQATAGPLQPFRAPPRADSRHFAHHDLVTAFWTALAVGSAQRGASLVAFRPEYELRAENPEAPLVPDALITLERNGIPLSLALEADCGTERPHVIARKIARYEALSDAGGELFGVRPDAIIFLTATERRGRRLAAGLDYHTRLPVIFGAPPKILEDGGVTTGLATADDIGRADQAESPFVHGLLSGIG